MYRTLHQFHEDIYGLFLCTDANELHDVGMVVLFEDPGIEMITVGKMWTRVYTRVV